MAKILQVKVKPNARQSALEANADGTWTAKVAAPPTDGQANRALIALVAERFGRPKSAVSIKSGASSRTKLVEIE